VEAEAVKTGNIPEEEALGGHLTKQLANRHTQATTLNNTQAIILSNNMQITMAKSTTRLMILMVRSTTAMVQRPNSIHSKLTQANPVSTQDSQTTLQQISLNMQLKRSIPNLHIRSRVINQSLMLRRKHRPMSLPITGKWLSIPLTRNKRSQLSRQSRHIITPNRSTSNPDIRITRQRFKITLSKSIIKRFQITLLISRRYQNTNTQSMITNPKPLSMKRKPRNKHLPTQAPE